MIKTNKTLILVLVAVILTLIYFIPMLINYKGYGIQDWDFSLAILEGARKSVVEYHQFPYWNPYRCGGTPSFANPETPIISLTFLLVLMFGTLPGVLISLFVHYVLGFLGMYKFAGIFCRDEFGKYVSAIIFVFSSAMSGSVAVGMLPFLGFMYAPWALYFVSKSYTLTNFWIKYSVFFALVVAIMFYYGYHALLYFSPILVIYCLILAKRYGIKRVIISNLVAMGIFIILTSPKLLMGIDFISNYPRQINDNTGYQPWGLVEMLLSRNQALDRDVGKLVNWYGIDESSIYVGWFAMLLVIISIKRKQMRIEFGMIIITVFGFLLRFGSAPIGWQFLKNLPFFDSARAVQRMRFDLLLYMSVLAGGGWDYIVNRLKVDNFWIKMTAVGILFVDLFMIGGVQHLKYAFTDIEGQPNYEQDLKGDDYKQVKYFTSSNKKQYVSNVFKKDPFKAWSFEYYAAKENFGVINCYDVFENQEASVGIEEDEYLGEVFVIGNGEFSLKYWSPNRVIVKVVETVGDHLIVINQNYNDNWIVNIGGKEFFVEEYKGLVAFKYKGEGEVVFEYNPWKKFKSKLL